MIMVERKLIMRISRILEELGDETISTHTPIMCPGGHLNIESVDIMEIVVKYSGLKTTVADILKLLLENVIVGSTEIKMYNGDDDPLDIFEDDFTENFLRITTTL